MESDAKRRKAHEAKSATLKWLLVHRHRYLSRCAPMPVGIPIAVETRATSV